MTFKDSYTTQALNDADPITNKDKIIISDLEYLKAEQREELNEQIKILNFRLRRR